MPPAGAQRIAKGGARSNARDVALPRKDALLDALSQLVATRFHPIVPTIALAPPFRIAARIQSVRCALNGIAVVVRSQHNAWVHFGATAAVVPAGFLLDVSRSDWCWLVLALASVWTAEAFNTALELLADVVSPGFHPTIGRAKDASAGAVLVAVLGAIAIGVLVLGPPLWARIAG